MRRTVCLISLLITLSVPPSPHESLLAAAQTPSSNRQSQENRTNSQQIRQAIHGTTYENQTAHFRLTVPKDWFVAENLMKQLPGIVGVLGAPGGSVAIMIQRFFVPGPKEGASLLDSRFKNSYQDYRKLSERRMKIDGKDAYSFTFRALFPVGDTKIPAKLWIVLIPDGESDLGFICQGPESVYDEFEPTLNKVITSYHRVPQ
jgi:hypothetical protein